MPVRNDQRGRPGAEDVQERHVYAHQNRNAVHGGGKRPGLLHGDRRLRRGFLQKKKGDQQRYECQKIGVEAAFPGQRRQPAARQHHRRAAETLGSCVPAEDATALLPFEFGGEHGRVHRCVETDSQPDEDTAEKEEGKPVEERRQQARKKNRRDAQQKQPPPSQQFLQRR